MSQTVKSSTPPATPPVTLDAAPDRPASLLDVCGSRLLGRAGVGLAEVFTSHEQRERTSQGYVRSAVGTRLRTTSVDAPPAREADCLRIVQVDPQTDLEVTTLITRPTSARAVRIETSVRNLSAVPVTLTAVSSVTVGFAHDEADVAGLVLSTAASAWLAENRWTQTSLGAVLPRLSLALHEQNGRGHHTLTSHGSWSTGEYLPVGLVTDPTTGQGFGWQIETGTGWHVDLSLAADGAVLSLLGPTDTEHQFAHVLHPGQSFDAVPVALAVSDDGRDGVAAELTRYRRWLRHEADPHHLPIVYNDFMNTLMGRPSTEELLPLIAAAGDAGAEVFCIDAGWFADPAIGDWWSTVGEWRVSESRFRNGLDEVVDTIRLAGMEPGIWLEPEVVGVDSPTATALPDEAFFTRFGERVREHDRYHLDFRHPAVLAHLDARLDALVADYGISYVKLDYNINPGSGTTLDAAAAGDGLLAHARAFVAWLQDVQRRHPGLRIENCASGAMRADYSLLAVTHLQSTSDQQDFRLYPPIAAIAPLSILPEQCADWAYPDATMTTEQAVFTLVTGLSGRLYLSGFLYRLDDEARSLVAEAVGLHKMLRHGLPDSLPFWPLGLPGWTDEAICLGLHARDRDLVFVWDRAEAASTIVLPGVVGDATIIFPSASAGWTLEPAPAGLTLTTTPGYTARVISIGKDQS